MGKIADGHTRRAVGLIGALEGFASAYSSGEDLYCELPIDHPVWAAIRVGWELEAEKIRQDTWRMLAEYPVQALLDDTTFARLCAGIPYGTATNLLETWAAAWWPIDSIVFDYHEIDELQAERESWISSGQGGVLPVGRDAILNDPRIGITGLDGATRFADTWAPFDGDDHAMVVLHAVFGRTVIDAFCLARFETWEDIDGTTDEWHEFAYWRASGEVRFWMAGDPSVSNLPEWKSRVERWWQHIAGLRFGRRGRPPGTGIYRDSAAFHAAYHEALEALARDNIRPRADLIATRLEVSRSTYYDYLKRYGTGE